MKVAPASFKYVGVRLMFHLDGKEVPEAIYWLDGRVFVVDDCIGRFMVEKFVKLCAGLDVPPAYLLRDSLFDIEVMHELH